MSNPVFSQTIRNAVCVYSGSSQPNQEVLIDEECQIQQISDGTTLVQWSDGVKTRIEVTWNVNQPRTFEGRIDGTDVSGWGYNTLDETCFIWNDAAKEVCFRYPTPKPQLSPGIYRLGSKYMSIFSRNGRFCWMGSSIHGAQVQSLHPSSTDPNTYVPEYFGGFLYAINSNTITWGGAEYSFDSAISGVPADVHRCLDFHQPFFERLATLDDDVFVSHISTLVSHIST